jgi:hypothetical protein
MNHLTPAEDFRARLAAASREQLEQAMHYLRGYDPDLVNRALASLPAAAPVALHMHAFIAGDDGTFACPCGLSLADWARQTADDAEFGHIALEGTL